LEGPQVIFPHDPHHTLVIDLHSSTVQLRGDSSIAVTAAMLEGNLLDTDRTSSSLLSRLLLFQRAVETLRLTGTNGTGVRCSALPCKSITSRILLVDAVSPVPPRFWRRGLDFCKTPFEKITFQGLLCQKLLQAMDFLLRGWSDACVLGRDASCPGSTYSSFLPHDCRGSDFGRTRSSAR